MKPHHHCLSSADITKQQMFSFTDSVFGRLVQGDLCPLRQHCFTQSQFLWLSFQLRFPRRCTPGGARARSGALVCMGQPQGAALQSHFGLTYIPSWNQTQHVCLYYITLQKQKHEHRVTQGSACIGVPLFNNSKFCLASLHQKIQVIFWEAKSISTKESFSTQGNTASQHMCCT